MLEKSQEKRILELRQKGYGYKSIVTILGIKRDTVRSLCKKYGLQGYLGLGLSKESEPQIREKNQYTHCIHCGKEINIQNRYRRGRKSKFCSDRCRRMWWYENQDKKERRETAWYHFVCFYCGKDFKAYGNKNRKFCSCKCTVDYRYGSYKEKTRYEKRKEDGTAQDE